MTQPREGIGLAANPPAGPVYVFRRSGQNQPLARDLTPTTVDCELDHGHPTSAEHAQYLVTHGRLIVWPHSPGKKYGLGRPKVRRPRTSVGGVARPHLGTDVCFSSFRSVQPPARPRTR